MDNRLKPKRAKPKFRKPRDTVEERARARLLTLFEDNQGMVFYSRQLEILYEREFFHWVTNRAIRSLVEEGRICSETRVMGIGSSVKILRHRNFRFYKREANDLVKLVDEYTNSATDGALGMQGEHMVLAAFARKRFTLIGEEKRDYNGKFWDLTNHDLDFIFERDGIGYGVEVKNTLGYLEHHEFITKIRLARHIGVVPVFAVRALPETWISTLSTAGGYSMIMGFQFYPWTHQDLAKRMRDTLGLPVDTPRRIQDGTMQRFENWISSSRGPNATIIENPRIEAMLLKEQAKYDRRRRARAITDPDEEGEMDEADEPEPSDEVE